MGIEFLLLLAFLLTALLGSLLFTVMVVLPFQGLQVRRVEQCQGLQTLGRRPQKLVGPGIEAAAHDDKKPSLNKLP